MTTTIDAAIARRIARWNALHNAAPGQRGVVMIRCNEPDSPPWPAPYPENRAQRVDFAMFHYEAALKRLDWLDDDTIPHLAVSSGTEIFAEAFGCKVHRPEGSNPCARPLLTDASQVARLKVPDLSHPSLAVLFEIADAFRARAGADAIVRIPDIQSPMDNAALIWDKSHFYVGIIDAPEAVHELADKCRELMETFCDAWFARYGTGYIAHFPDYYMPAGLTLSEDEIGAVSGEMFDEFFLPQLAALSNRYGGLGIHCCANARHQWDHFLRIPNLRVLNLTQNERIAREAYAYFGPRLVHMHHGPPSAEWILENSPSDARVILEVGADSRDDAVAKAERFRQLLDA